MSEKIIQVAILGQGRSGYGIHVRWLREAREQYRIVAVADLLPERHEAVAEQGARAYGDYQELLSDKELKADLVVNALPSHLHAAGTIAALKAGYHVLSEKPFALTLKDFDAMVDTAKHHERHLLAFQNSRFQPAFQKIIAVLASGKLGTLVHARIKYSGFARRWDWQASQRHAGGNLNNTAPHPLDQAIVLFGDRTPQVFSRLTCHNPFGDAEDFAAVSLYGENAPLIEVIVSSFMAYPQGEIYNLSCTRGGLTGDFQNLKWRYFDPAKAPTHKPASGWSDQRAYNGESLPWVEESWANNSTADNFQQISQGIYDDAYNVLVRGTSSQVKLEQVRRQIAVIQQCHEQNPLPMRYEDGVNHNV